jgi:hypothetical protein
MTNDEWSKLAGWKPALPVGWFQPRMDTILKSEIRKSKSEAGAPGSWENFQPRMDTDEHGFFKKAPNTKHQHPERLQAPNFKS